MITRNVQHHSQQYPVKFDDDATLDGQPISEARLVISREDGILKVKAYLGAGKTRSLTRMMFGCTTIPVNGDYLDLRKENQRPLTGKDKSDAARRGVKPKTYNTRTKRS